MDYYCKRRRSKGFFNKPPLFYFMFIIIFFFFFFYVSTLFCCTTKCPDSSSSLSAKADTYFQEVQGSEKPVIVESILERKEVSLGLARRFLGGPGSSPPRCTSKCGKCTPCKPVHVAVPPGTPVTAEYYPEAWRCKCGNKLYMP